MKAVFLDRDGTLNVDSGYVADPSNVALVPNAAQGLRMLADAGFALVVVSNQSGIARGYFTLADAEAVDQRVRELLAAEGVMLAGMYRCPHLAGAADLEYGRDCDCRKPKPGMLLHAAADLGLALGQSWMVGDRVSDMQAGRAAGCRCVSVTGMPPCQPPEDFSGVAVEYRARDLLDAANFITTHTAPAPRAKASR